MKKSYEHNLRKSFPNRFGRRVREVVLSERAISHLASVFTYWIFRLQSAEDLRHSEFQVFLKQCLFPSLSPETSIVDITSVVERTFIH